MLAPAVIREIERLLEEDRYSRRQIAERLGVARSSVTAVARRLRQTDDYLEQTPDSAPPLAIKRCPSCRAMVRMPCRLCQTRELIAGRQIPRMTPVTDNPVGLQLKPEHQARYAQVRRWRREALRLGIITNPREAPDPEDPS